MNLEIARYHVRSVRWGDKCFFEKGNLTIHKEELEKLLAEDTNLEKVELQLVHPGEKTRIVKVLDILDARNKDKEVGEAYPGITGKNGVPGIGRTNVLTDLILVESGDVGKMQSSTSMYFGVLDMWGPAADLTNLSQKHALVLNCSFRTTASYTNALALKKTSIKASKYLADIVQGADPDEVTEYSITESRIKEPLPKIAYIYITECHNDLKESYIYGTNSRYFLPFYINPNELMDGAMVCMSYEYSAGHRSHTYNMVNNPIIEELYRRHGKDLEFVGVIIANAHLREVLKKRSAAVAAKIARYNLGADGVVISKEGGGHPVTDQMFCCEECEKLGIKSSLIVEEVLSPDGSGMSVVYHSDYADLVTSVGNHEELIQVPTMEKIAGNVGNDDREVRELLGEREIRSGVIPNALSVVGNTKVGAVNF